MFAAFARKQMFSERCEFSLAQRSLATQLIARKSRKHAKATLRTVPRRTVLPVERVMAFGLMRNALRYSHMTA
jgi:hypothetical protein